MRDEQRREPDLEERVDRVERLRRRAALERRRAPTACSRRTSASAIGCGDSQIAAAVASARNSRFGDSIRWTNADASGPSTNSSARENQPPTRLSSSSVAATHDDGGLDDDVAMADMGELVRQHRFELCRRRGREEARADCDRRPAGPRPVASARGSPSSHQIQPRLRNTGDGCERARPSSAVPATSPTGSSRARTSPSATRSAVPVESCRRAAHRRTRRSRAADTRRAPSRSSRRPRTCRRAAPTPSGRCGRREAG